MLLLSGGPGLSWWLVGGAGEGWFGAVGCAGGSAGSAGLVRLHWSARAAAAAANRSPR